MGRHRGHPEQRVGTGDLRNQDPGSRPARGGRADPGAPRPGRLMTRRRPGGWLGPIAGLWPWSICFAVFGLVPLFTALFLSFFDMNPLRPDRAHWVGLSNYARALASPAFWHALRTTAIFVVGTLPVTLTLAYGVAALLSRLRRGET